MRQRCVFVKDISDKFTICASQLGPQGSSDMESKATIAQAFRNAFDNSNKLSQFKDVLRAFVIFAYLMSPQCSKALHKVARSLSSNASKISLDLLRGCQELSIHSHDVPKRSHRSSKMLSRRLSYVSSHQTSSVSTHNWIEYAPNQYL